MINLKKFWSKGIKMKEIAKVLEEYDHSAITIGVLGGHSALDVCRGAKKQGFRTVAVCEKGRDKTYSQYYKSDGEKGIVDEVILVDKFSDITSKSVQDQLRSLNTIFVHNRYFWVYCDFEKIEKDFKVPIYGSRSLVKLEERDVPKNQYYLLEKAGIRIPQIFKQAKDIDKLAIVKVNEAERGYERAFFFCNNLESYEAKSKELLDKKTITSEGLKKAVIEEYVLGAHVNFNYFYSPLTESLELMGTDTRRQTNLDGFLRLPADEQLLVLEKERPKLIETGHIAVTIKESLLEKAFEAGEKFISACKKEVGGLIGPFALQGAVVAEKGKEEIVIFDVSLRIPGSPGTASTPYSGYLYMDSMSYGERIAMEIQKALGEEKLDSICT
jgi:5-formaminoimidazole-4-carboxamide-1-(beta)-D-ribofuranosyl 5'-monophosphate synthetase